MYAEKFKTSSPNKMWNDHPVKPCDDSKKSTKVLILRKSINLFKLTGIADYLIQNGILTLGAEFICVLWLVVLTT